MINNWTDQYLDTYTPLPEHAIFMKLTSHDRTVNANQLLLLVTRSSLTGIEKLTCPKLSRLAILWMAINTVT